LPQGGHKGRPYSTISSHLLSLGERVGQSLGEGCSLGWRRLGHVARISAIVVAHGGQRLRRPVLRKGFEGVKKSAEEKAGSRREEKQKLFDAIQPE
jgi:hypothetical protein